MPVGMKCFLKHLRANDFALRGEKKDSMVCRVENSPERLLAFDANIKIEGGPVSHFLDVVPLSRFSCQWTKRVK